MPTVTEATVAPTEAQAYSPYRQILSQYATAIEEKWTVEQLAPTELGEKIADFTGYDDLGYAFMDLNGDGSEELLITDGCEIYGLYTVQNGEVQPQWLGHANMTCHLCEDNVLAETVEGMGWFYSFVKLGETVLEPFWTMTYAPEKDASSPWFLGNPYTEPDAPSLDGGEAVARLQSYNQVYIRNIPFRMGLGEVAREDYVPEDPSVYLPAIREMQADYTYAEPMTYTFYDMDADGRKELLLGSGNAIRRVVQEENGIAQSTSFSGEQSHVYLCEGDILWDVSLRGHWFTDMDGNVVQFVYHREETGSWYKRNPEKSPDVPIEEREAKEILASFKRLYLDWKPIGEFPGAAAVREQAEPEVLSVYRQALAEKWDPAQCEAAGITYMVGFFTERPGELGYAWLDLDGGEEELLITDGRQILDLYTVKQGEAELLFSGGERYAYTLMADKGIFFQGSGSAFTSYHTLYRLVDGALAEEESYIFDAGTDPENPWFFGAGGILGQPCGDFDAEARIAELTAAEIPFTPFF